MKKDVLLVICALFTVGSIAFAVYAFEKQHRLTKTLEEERYGRMVAEESSQRSAAKLATLENQIKIAENQVKTADGKMAKLKDILDQEKNVNSDLKDQYDKLAKIKADLEAKLKSTMDEKANIAQQQVEAGPQSAVQQADPTASMTAAANAGAQ